jgi:MFS family permease
VENLNSINSALIGNFVITLPLLVLFFARSIDGITGGNISVANAYLADISSDENRSNNFGKMAISSNLGFIVGSETDTIFKIGLRRPFKKFTIVGAAATTIIKC